jgi:hypothetical protein
MKANKYFVFCLFLGLLGIMPLCHAGSTLDAAKSSAVRCQLTELDEFRTIFGKPIEEIAKPDGDMSVIGFRYENGLAIFGKPKSEEQTPFVLYRLNINEKDVDIGCNSKMVLRNEKDLRKVNKFSGLSSVSLKQVDLRNQSEFLNPMTFDTETEWPDKLPEGFNPDRIIELGKNPGLGIRELHKDGINGQGIGIAIIDQPLLLGHDEYRDRIVYYDAVEVPGHPTQMHGAPVASIAAGKTLGVAPGARLYYFATPTWKNDNRYYAEALERVMQLNDRLPKDEQIRVASISKGDFERAKNYPLWERALEKAIAQGIYVSTCSREPISYLNLVLDFDKDPDDPASYAPTGWTKAAPKDPNRFYVPGGNRTVASHRGVEVYQLYREGGLSWSAPYLAGLAALAFQVRPDLSPADIVKLIKDTATPMPFGKIVNPRKLISEAKALKK